MLFPSNWIPSHLSMAAVIRIRFVVQVGKVSSKIKGERLFISTRKGHSKLSCFFNCKLNVPTLVANTLLGLIILVHMEMTILCSCKSNLSSPFPIPSFVWSQQWWFHKAQATNTWQPTNTMMEIKLENCHKTEIKRKIQLPTVLVNSGNPPKKIQQFNRVGMIWPWIKPPNPGCTNI